MECTIPLQSTAIPVTFPFSLPSFLYCVRCTYIVVYICVAIGMFMTPDVFYSAESPSFYAEDIDHVIHFST